MSSLDGELDDIGYRRRHQQQHLNELIREMHDLYDSQNVAGPPEDVTFLNRAQDLYSAFPQHPDLQPPAMVPSIGPLPPRLPQINPAAPTAPSLPPLPPASLVDKLLKPRRTSSAPHSPPDLVKANSTSSLVDRCRLQCARSPASTSPTPCPSTKLPSAVALMALPPSLSTPTHLPYPVSTQSNTCFAPNSSISMGMGTCISLPPATTTTTTTTTTSPSSLHPPLQPSNQQQRSPDSASAPSPALSIISAPCAVHAGPLPASSCASQQGPPTCYNSVRSPTPPYPHTAHTPSSSAPSEVPGARRESFESSDTKAGSPQTDANGRYRKRGCGEGGVRYEFGSDYVPGKLPEALQGEDIPNLPAKSGIGIWLRPARVGPCSCVPPPHPEPLQPPSSSLASMLTMHDQLRELQPDAVINRVVFDCILPPSALSCSNSADGSYKQNLAAGLPGVMMGETAVDVSPSELASSLFDSPPYPPDPLSPSGALESTPDRAPCSSQYNYFPDLPCWYSVAGPDDRTLVFESRYEGGNLRRAIQVYPFEYDLVLRPDVNTKRHTQWFYFAILNTRKGQRYKFNIINLMKEDSLYSIGMLPLIHSEEVAKSSKLRQQQQRRRQQQRQQQQERQQPPQEYEEQLLSNQEPSSRSASDAASISLGEDLPQAPEQEKRPCSPSGQACANNACNLPGEVSFGPQFGASSCPRKGEEDFDEEQQGQQQDDSKRDHEQGQNNCLEHEGGYTGWHRGGDQVCYYRNTIKKKGRGGGKRYFTLSFTYTAEHDNDVVHFAHCFPFTYTDLQVYLKALDCHPQRSPFVQRSLLTTTLAGNAVDCLTITAPSAPTDPTRKKKGVVITARVHPGESNSSWMVKGLIEYLTGSSAEADMLRKHFVFKVVPMLNPDGVVVGNYRCNLAGFDLNRTWADASRKLHPTIHACKAMLKQFMEERQVVLFSDFHGHSRKPNIFSYGCGKKPSGGKDWAPVWPGYPVPGSVGGLQDIPVRFQGRLFPLLMQYSAPDLFCYAYCTVKVQKSKAGTSRVVVFREMGLTNSFTLEASIAGASMGRQAGQHFTTRDLEQMGAALASALADYWDPLSYGIPELLHELDALHTASGDLEQQPEGEDSTDSDDDPSSDDGVETLSYARALKPGKAGGRGRRRGGPTTSQLRNLSREYTERAAAGLMDVLSSCTTHQQQHHPQQQQQQHQQQLLLKARQLAPVAGGSTWLPPQQQPPLQAQQWPMAAHGDSQQEVSQPPLLPQLQGIQASSQSHPHSPYLAPGKLALQPPAQHALRPSLRPPAPQPPNQQQQQYIEAARAQADVEHFRSMEHLRARGIYRGDTLSWANAPGRLSTTNVNFNVQEAERQAEETRQQDSLDGWDSIVGVVSEAPTRPRAGRGLQQ